MMEQNGEQTNCSMVDSPFNDDKTWHPFASFVVVFQKRKSGSQVEKQTVIHHMESAKGTVWSGIEGKQLGQWILDQLEDSHTHMQQEK